MMASVRSVIHSRLKQRERSMSKCPKCNDFGWVWGYELDNASEETASDTMTKYSCDWEGHSLSVVKVNGKYEAVGCNWCPNDEYLHPGWYLYHKPTDSHYGPFEYEYEAVEALGRYAESL